MSTYGRILSYAKPYHRYFPQYIVFALLAIIFGLTNLALLEPLFTIIFETKDAESELNEVSLWFRVKVYPFLCEKSFLSEANPG